MENFIKLYRKITDNWVWADKPFSKGQAWIDLLILANYKDKRFPLGNEIIEAEQGQVITSELKLMDRWGWSKSKVRAFLALLQKDGMILKKADKKKTIITICNYSDYNDFQTTEKPQADREQTTSGPRTDTNKKEKKEKKEENIIPPISPKSEPDEFDEFWTAYPRKVGKGAAQKSWAKIKPSSELHKKILAAIDEAKESQQWQRDKGQYIPNPSTWLNQRRWEDELPKKGDQKHGLDAAGSGQLGAFNPKGMAGFRNALDRYDDEPDNKAE